MASPRSVTTTLARLFSVRPQSPVSVTLQVKPELGVLQARSTVSEVIDSAVIAPGSLTHVTPSATIEEQGLKLQLAGRTAGADKPVWADGSGGAPQFGVCLCRVKDALYSPEFGSLILPDGTVLKSTIAEALYFTPDLGRLPGVATSDGVAIMDLPQDAPVIPKASIFMAWGGRFNYGHFLLDCLSALCVVDEEGLLDRYPAIAPKLLPWHRDLLRLMLGPKASMIRETDDEVLKIGDAVFSTSMDHFLHAPNAPLDAVRSRILSRLPALNEPGPARIYLSRRKDGKRRMLNEDALEARLRALNFEIVHPQTLGVDAQIQLFRTAEVVVGATGAAFANCLFCPPSTKVFEIQPSNFTGIWTRGLCHYCALDWHGYFAPSPMDDEAAELQSEQSHDGMFDWALPLDDFMSFLTSRLDDLS